MNKKIKKYIYNIKKYSWIIMLIYIYLFTSLISSISEKTLEFRNVSINAEKMSYFSSNNTSSNKSTNNNNNNNSNSNNNTSSNSKSTNDTDKDKEEKEDKEKEQEDIERKSRQKF
ncbi:MAG: hypothetical protein HG454_004740 [Clostridiales bacterium]|nr:hypothetical protein [Clostridiales bacterium]